jgi:hypothetical protein
MLCYLKLWNVSGEMVKETFLKHKGHEVHQGFSFEIFVPFVFENMEI